MAAPTKNTVRQLVEVARPVANGTRSTAVPLAVYRRPAFPAAYFQPYVSAQVAGNRL